MMNTRNIRFRSNRVRDILALMHEELDALYGRDEVAAFGEMLFDAFLGWNRVRLLSSREATIDQSDLLRFHWALEDLKQFRPIQHIIGHTDFCGCRIEVNPSVLIPRPETEEMVRWTLAAGRYGHVLDLCTGSGCIAIALKKAWPQAAVEAVDVSTQALQTARANAAANGVEVAFREGNLLDTRLTHSLQQCSLLVSNPPYVRESERAAMRPNVLEYEPPKALFVPDDDPLVFYRAIAHIAQRCLSQAGLLVVEINEALADETSALLRDSGFAPEVHTDFFGKPRWVSALRS